MASDRLVVAGVCGSKVAQFLSVFIVLQAIGVDSDPIGVDSDPIGIDSDPTGVAAAAGEDRIVRRRHLPGARPLTMEDMSFSKLTKEADKHVETFVESGEFDVDIGEGPNASRFRIDVKTDPTPSTELLTAADSQQRQQARQQQQQQKPKVQQPLEQKSQLQKQQLLQQSQQQQPPHLKQNEQQKQLPKAQQPLRQQQSQLQEQQQQSQVQQPLGQLQSQLQKQQQQSQVQQPLGQQKSQLQKQQQLQKSQQQQPQVQQPLEQQSQLQKKQQLQPSQQQQPPAYQRRRHHRRVRQNDEVDGIQVEAFLIDDDEAASSSAKRKREEKERLSRQLTQQADNDDSYEKYFRKRRVDDYFRKASERKKNAAKSKDKWQRDVVANGIETDVTMVDDPSPRDVGFSWDFDMDIAQRDIAADDVIDPEKEGSLTLNKLESVLNSNESIDRLQLFSDNPSLSVRWDEPAMMSNCWLHKLLANRYSFSPSCKPDGTYYNKQCYLERCWCVDNEGRPRDRKFLTRFAYKKYGSLLYCTPQLHSVAGGNLLRPPESEFELVVYTSPPSQKPGPTSAPSRYSSDLIQTTRQRNE